MWNPTIGFAPTQPGVAGGGRFAPQGQPAGLSSNEMLLAGFAHLSSFFAPLIFPLCIWLLVRDTMPYASRQGKQAFFFHLMFNAIVWAAALIFFITFFFLGLFSHLAAPPDGSGTLPGLLVFYPLWFFLFFGVVLIASLGGQVFSIYAAVQTFQGKPFSYPFLKRL
jgi:uncharacterized Tic20 family protein